MAAVMSTRRAEGALAYPGALPGPATITGKERTICASNAAMEMTWSWTGTGLKLQGLKDTQAAQSLALKGEVFQIELEDGHRYAASELTPVGEPRFQQLLPDLKSSRLAARIPGQQVDLKLRSKDGRMAVVWRAVLRTDGNYVRQEMDVTPADDCVIADITWLDETILGAASAGTVDGSPMVAGNLFFGLEDPHALNSAGRSQKVIGNWTPADLDAGKTQRKAWPVNAVLLGSGTNEFLFEYQRGKHRLDITRVTLSEDGRVVARDEHAGWSGKAGVRNVYVLPLTRVDSQARYEVVAELGTDPKMQLPAGSIIDSFGVVSLRRQDGLVSFRLPRHAPLRAGQTLTTSLVMGIAPVGQMRRAFTYYVEQERAHAYRTFLHYNTWYDISPWHFPPEGWDPYAMNETNSLDAIRTYGERLLKRHGVILDSMVFDDGWNDIDNVWGFHPGFPRGFTPHAALAREYGTALGVWLSPRGGGVKAKEHRLAAGSALGYETNAAGFSLAGPKYYAAFKGVCLRMMQEYGVNYFKFDGIGQGTTEAATKTAGAGAAFLLDTDALRRLMLELREEDPSLFINFTSGSWPSPFWLRYADSVWRQGLDTGVLGKGPAQQRGLTYRDSKEYQNIVQRAPLYPLNALMSGGITYARHGRPSNPTYDSAGLKDDIRSYFGSGTGLQELYIQPSRLTTNDWAVLAEAAKWSRANQDVLVDTHWLGGNPAKSQVYGWASWSPRKGIVTLRNPDDQPHEFVLDVATIFELPAGAATKYTLKSPWADEAHHPALAAEAGRPLRLTLKPFEVVVLDAVPST
jgi:hypothetical protein